MANFSRAVLLALALMLWACPAPPHNGPAYVGGDCGLACKALEAYGCPEGDPTPAGVDCLSTCNERGRLGVLNVGCVQEAKTADDFKACHVTCTK